MYICFTNHISASSFFFFFNDTATTEIYTLSLHDALPISLERVLDTFPRLAERLANGGDQLSGGEQQMLSIGRALMTHPRLLRSEEHTSELQSQSNLVCRLLLEKKKKNTKDMQLTQSNSNT